jgi:hypothetical protein
VKSVCQRTSEPLALSLQRMAEGAVNMKMDHIKGPPDDEPEKSFDFAPDSFGPLSIAWRYRIVHFRSFLVGVPPPKS